MGGGVHPSEVPTTWVVTKVVESLLDRASLKRICQVATGTETWFQPLRGLDPGIHERILVIELQEVNKGDYPKSHQ